MSLTEAMPLITQMAAGLQAAHDAGIVHRDFKSSNVILVGDRAVITDFGLARFDFSTSPQASTMSVASQFAGTIDYMSPEQLSGEIVTTASDIYSFGIVLYEMASGRVPFKGRHFIHAALQRFTGNRIDVRSLVPDIDGRWASVIDNCLEQQPEKRPRSLRDVVAVLESGGARKATPAASHVFRNSLLAVFVVVLLIAISLALFRFDFRFNQRGLIEGSKIMMTPTVNASGEEGFAGLDVAFQASVNQSARFVVWDSGRLGPILRAMRRDPQDKLLPADWRQVAFRDNANMLVFSTLSRVGNTYALAVHSEEIGKAPEPPVRSWDRTFTGLGENGVFDAVHEATSWIRSIAGESVGEVSERNRLPQDITSSNWQALALFTEAQRLSTAGKAISAIPLFRRAVQLDPQFAMALMRLGDILNAQRNGQEGFAYWREAIKEGRLQRLSDRERLSIESRYALEIGDYAGAEPILREWVAKFPNDATASDYLSACLTDLGRFPEVVSVGRRGRERFAPTLFGTFRIIEALAMSGQTDQLGPELSVLAALGAPLWEIRLRGVLSAMREDYDSAGASFQELLEKSEGEAASRAISLSAALAAERGDLSQAATLLEAGISHDRQAGEQGLASQKVSALAFVEYLRGNREKSRAWAMEAVTMLESPQVVMQSVSVLARQGFLADAKRVMSRMPAGEGPRHEIRTLRMQGEIAEAEGRYVKAVDILEQAVRKESAIHPQEYWAHALALAGYQERARIAYSSIVKTPWQIWASPESEWPGLRLLAKKYLQTPKGD
jgi:tetratricopeptide (TPR) repeat protein